MTVKEMRAELARMIAIEKEQKASDALLTAQADVDKAEAKLKMAQARLAIVRERFASVAAK